MTSPTPDDIDDLTEPIDAATEEATPRHAAAEVTAEPDPVQHPPLMEVRDLRLGHHGHPVFGPVTTTLPSHALVALHGPSGSGRSSLLLALAGRMRGTTGTADFTDAPTAMRHLDRWKASRKHRRDSSIARISGLVDLDPNLTVGESLTERCLTDHLPTATGHHRFESLSHTAGTRFDQSALVGSLSARDQTLLAAILALVRPARLVVIDDTDAGLDTDGQAEVHQILNTLAATEHATIVASTCDLRGIPDDTVIIPLSPTVDQDS